MKRILPVAALLLMLSAVPAFAAGKIGVAQIDQITAQSDMGKESERLLNAQFGKERDSLDKEAQAFQKKVEDFQKQAAALSDKARMDKAQELDRLNRELMQKQDAYNRKVAPVAEQINTQVIQTLDQAIENFSKANGYDIIINAQAVVYATDATNVSSSILTEANKVWKSKGGKFKITK